MLGAVVVDVVSDVVCPWCYIGKRRLEAALAQLRESNPDLPFEIRWHPFQLNPDLPAEGVDRKAYLEAKFGGPDRAFENVATPVSDTILIESNHQLHSGTFNLVARSHSGGAVNGYFLVGPGVYYRKVQLTSPGVGVITVCDPYWLVCYPAPVETTQILGDRSSTDFGVNFGGGITFGHAAKFYVEARYHYVWGPKFSASGTDFSSNAQYVPITFGVRF